MACRVLIPDNRQVVNTAKIIKKINNVCDNITDEELSDIKAEIDFNASTLEMPGKKRLQASITEDVFSEPVNKVINDEPISPATDTCQDEFYNEDNMLNHHPERDFLYCTTPDKEFTISDIYEQATLIGQDIEEVNSKYGCNVTGALMPKLIFVLDKLESFIVQSNDNKSMVKALLLENEDLKLHKGIAENDTQNLSVQLEDAEFLSRNDDRKLNKRIKFLKVEKKVLSKEIKKRNRKLKKLRRGEEGSTILWFLDRCLFSGRLFFVTKELPRDIEAIDRLDAVINSQKHELYRLSSEIEIQGKEKDAVAKNINILSDVNNYLENQTFLIKTRLSQLGVESESDLYREIQKTYKKLPVDDIGEGDSPTNELIDDDETDFNVSYDYSDLLLREAATASSYWDLLNTRSLDDKILILETSAIPYHDEDVTTKMATINTQLFEPDAYVCGLDKQKQQGDIGTTTTNYTTYESGNLLSHDDSNLQVEVEIHANRKDNKKLLLAQELRDCISATTEGSGIDTNYSGYHHMDSNVIMNGDGTYHTCYWDDVDSKTSYEDVSSVTSSSDDTLQNHFYFILDKRNMRAKKVEHEEYQNALQKSISLRKGSKTDREGKLSSSRSAYHHVKTANKIAQLHEENTLHIL